MLRKLCKHHYCVNGHYRKESCPLFQGALCKYFLLDTKNEPEAR